MFDVTDGKGCLEPMCRSRFNSGRHYECPSLLSYSKCITLDITTWAVLLSKMYTYAYNIICMGKAVLNIHEKYAELHWILNE